MRRWVLGTIGLGFLLSGCGGSSNGSFNPGPEPTIPSAPILVDFMFTANAGSDSLSQFVVNNTATGALSGANSISIDDGGLPASPLGELLDPGSTAPAGDVAERAGGLYVAVPHGLLSFSYMADIGSPQAVQTTSVAPAGGGTLTGPLAEDTSFQLLYAATTSGIDVYVIAGASVSQPSVSNAVALSGVSSLATVVVNNSEVLLATSPAGLTVYPINTANLATGNVLGTPVGQVTLATPQQASANASVAGSSSGSILVAVAEAAGGTGTNGETFNLTDAAGTPALSNEETFKVGIGDTTTAVTVGGSTVYAGDANGAIAGFPVANGTLSTAATAQLSGTVTSVFFLAPAAALGPPVLYATTANGAITPLTIGNSTLTAQSPVSTGAGPTAAQGSSTELIGL